MRSFAAAAVAALLVCVLGTVASRGIPSSYDTSITNVLKSEGSEYTNHPADPGGPTKYGITLKDVRLYIDHHATAVTVKALTRDQALTVYHDKYWLHRCVRGDQLPAGVDYSLFDYGVNAGVGRSGIVLRRLMGVPANKCDVTDALLELVAKRDARDLISAIAEERRRFYRNLIAARPSLGVFRRGWMTRADSVERVALRLAGGPPDTGLLGEPVEPEAEFGPGKAWLESVR